LVPEGMLRFKLQHFMLYNTIRALVNGKDHYNFHINLSSRNLTANQCNEENKQIIL